MIRLPSAEQRDAPQPLDLADVVQWGEPSVAQVPIDDVTGLFGSREQNKLRMFAWGGFDGKGGTVFVLQAERSFEQVSIAGSEIISPPRQRGT